MDWRERRGVVPDRGPEPAMVPLRPEPAVLLVEGDPVFRFVHGRLMRTLGAMVLTASNEEEALAVVQKIPLELILLDPGQCQLDGTGHAAERWRSLGRDTLLVAASHFLDRSARRFCLAAGFHGWCHKPLGARTIGPWIERARRQLVISPNVS